MAGLKFDEVDDGTIIDVIQESVKVEILNVAEDQLVSREVFLPPVPPVVSALRIHTLAGIVDYLNNDSKIDHLLEAAPGATAPGLAVHIVSESQVDVVGPVSGRFRQRETFVEATANKVLGKGFQFGEYSFLEPFNIALKALFIPTDDIDAILQITGNISADDTEQWKDDGVSQTVIAKTSLTRVGEVNIARLFSLKPYRTFREIDQPGSDFLLRLVKSQQGPKAALFDTDGGGWKLMAIERIRGFLKQNLTAEIPIIG